jgi:DNA-binding transcriptional MerR regulator
MFNPENGSREPEENSPKTEKVINDEGEEFELDTNLEPEIPDIQRGIVEKPRTAAERDAYRKEVETAQRRNAEIFEANKRGRAEAQKLADEAGVSLEELERIADGKLPSDEYDEWKKNIGKGESAEKHKKQIAEERKKYEEDMETKKKQAREKLDKELSDARNELAAKFGMTRTELDKKTEEGGGTFQLTKEQKEHYRRDTEREQATAKPKKKSWFSRLFSGE